MSKMYGTKLTGRQRRIWLGRIGERVQSEGCNVLDALCSIYEEQDKAADTAATILLRKLAWKCGVGLAFERELDRRRLEREHAKDKNANPPPVYSHAAAQNVAAALAKDFDAAAPAERRNSKGDAIAAAFARDAAKPAEHKPLAAEPAPGSMPAPNTAPTTRAVPTQSASPRSGYDPSAPPVTHSHETMRGEPQRSIDLSTIAQPAARLKDALCARTMSRTVRETERGSLDRTRLAQIGGGLTLRPYQDTTAGRSLDSAVYLLLDTSSSMNNRAGYSRGPSRIDHVATAALGIAQACASARVPLSIGVFHTNAATIWRGEAGLHGARYALESLRGIGGTNTPLGMMHATGELRKSRAKRRILIVLCDGYLVAGSPVWAAATAAGIDWRVVGLNERGRCEESMDQVTADTEPLWKNRLHIGRSGADAARLMLEELRTLLEHGAREDVQRAAY